MTSWAGDYGATAISGTTTKLMAPESFYYSQATNDALLADPKAASNISIVGGHLYGGAPNYPGSAETQGKDVWMTEHFLDSVNKSDTKTSWATSIDDAIAIAKEIHDGLTLSQYNAYVHWWLVNSNDATPTGLISMSNTLDLLRNRPEALLVLHSSGLRSLRHHRAPAKGVRVSSFGTPSGAADSKAVVVLVNENAVDVTLTASINPAGRSLSALTPYRTTATATFERLPAIGVSGNAFSVLLPAKSITTLVN